MVNEYIEIVHMGPDDIERLARCGPKRKAIAERISQLAITPGVHYLLSDYWKDIPDLPKDTPIRLGGAMWDICVHGRAIELKIAGYTNVTPDRKISLAWEDAMGDTFGPDYRRTEEGLGYKY